MIKRHTISIKNAVRGFWWAITTQPNFKIHFILSAIAIILGMILHISYAEFLAIFILILIGLTIETINTAIEETTDAIDTKWRNDIGLAKDVSAGAMLMFSLGAVVISSVIFIPKLVQLLHF